MTNLTDGDACLMSGTTPAAVKDTLAKLALIGSMVMCFAIIIAWVGGSFHRLVQFIVTLDPSKVASLLVGSFPGESPKLLEGHRSF
jgi:hypothetical protein